MTWRLRLLAWSSALVGAALAISGCTTTTRKHPEFTARRAQMASVAVVPPQVEMTLVVFKGDNQPLPEETAKIQRRLPDLIAAQLRQHGFTVKDAGLDEEHFAAQPDLRFQTTQVQSAFARANEEMFKVAAMQKSEAEACKLSLGPDVNQLSEHADADGLVFAKMSGFKKTGGEITKDVAMTVLIAAATLGSVIPVQPTKGASLQIALVDGTTGDILWANTAGTGGDFEESGLDSMVQRLFAGFPK